MNGTVEGDEEGKFAYTGSRGKSMIDYMVREEKVRKRMVRMEVGDCVESDHHPLMMLIEGKERRLERRVRTNK